MNEKDWLDYATAIGAIATPIVVLLLAGVGWRIRKKIERRIDLEEKLRKDRIAIYNSILEPFIIFFVADAAWKSDPKTKKKDKFKEASGKLLSLEYRKSAFQLALMGSDAVVLAYNRLMQLFFSKADVTGHATEDDTAEMLSRLGDFLLEIRKSMGNDATKLDNCAMLEWFISDVRKVAG